MDRRSVIRALPWVPVLLLLLPAAPAGASLALPGLFGYVRVPHSPAFNPRDGLTVEAWVRRENTNRCEAVIGKNFRTGFWLGFCPGAIRFYTSGRGTQEDGRRPVPAGAWTHVAVTFDGRVRRYYLNGMLDHERASGRLPANRADLGIGADSDGLYAFLGNLAEVRVWSVARDLADVRGDMMRPAGGREPGLVAAWHLERDAADATGRHPGSAVGMVSFEGEPAPTFVHDPIVAPRVAAAPALDGRCAPGEYGRVRLPMWYATEWGPRNAAVAHVAATATDLYVCVAGAQTDRAADVTSFVSVYVDPDGSGDETPQPDDFRVSVFETGAQSSERGNGFGGYETAALPGYAAAGSGRGGETWTGPEFRIPRSALRPEFRMHVEHHWLTRQGDDRAWPEGVAWNAPRTWPRFRIGDD